MKDNELSNAVALYPQMNEDGTWNGVMSVVIETMDMSHLPEETAMQLEMFTGMVAACVDLMSNDPKIMLAAQEHYLSRLEEEDELAAEKEKAAINNSRGKVVELRPNTKTFGNA